MRLKSTGLLFGIVGMISLLGVAVGPVCMAQAAGVPNTLHLVEQVDIPTLDPAQWADGESLIYMRAIYDNLVRYAPDSTTFEPDLATSWQVLDGGKEYIFTLRQGVKFSNGDPFDANVVKSDFERLTAPKAAAPYGSSYSVIAGYTAWNSGKAKDFSGIRVLSPYKIEFVLTQPVGYFLNLMALEAAAIGDPKVEQQYGYKDYLDHAVGTGPYMLAKWIHNRELDLVANPNYGGWAGPKPSIKYVDTVIGPSDAEQLQLFQKGEVDYYGGRGGGVSSSSYLEILSTPSLKKLYHRGIDVDIFYTGFHVNQPPFNNPVVRQAVNYAVNKQQLLAVLTNGRGTLDNDGLYTPGLPGYQASAHDQYPYDPAKALKLLASVGISPSHPVNTELVTYNAPHVLQQAEIVQADLKAVGINVSIKSMAVGPFLSYVSDNSNPYGLYNSSWGQDYPDPQDFFYFLFDKSQINGGSNNAGWTDPKFQALITRADAMPSTQENARIELYRQANQILVQQAPWVFMYYGWADALVQPWVHYSSPGNIGLGPVYPLEFNYLTLSKH